MAQQKQPWDTRAWLFGILGGGLVGSVAAGTNYPPIVMRLNSPSIPFIGHHGGEAVSIGFGLAGLLVLPGLLSGLARRWTFFWGLVPLCLLLAILTLVKWRLYGVHQVVADWWINFAVLGGCLLVSSGPVSLIRWLRVRAVRRRQAALASYTAMREAASTPQEGVWPPPPDYRA